MDKKPYKKMVKNLGLIDQLVEEHAEGQVPYRQPSALWPYQQATRNH
ncbi:hypothetical protein [uncultured Sphaerochaeta sp.]|nr:hypothetical protein [uncultured Sphaerochaeta sp.]